MISERWEHGSELHLMVCAGKDITQHPWERRNRTYASGRDAFHALLQFGRVTRGWKRLLVPGYYCQKVVASLAASGLDLVLYDDGPDCDAPSLASVSLRAGDVLLLVNYFGLRTAPLLPALRGTDVEVIEDHTHDPWSDWATSSEADWCVASLRKTLPVPDGGVLWSPAGHTLPVAARIAVDRKLGSLNRMAAMLLKSMYLDGAQVTKEAFRDLYSSAERVLDTSAASGMTPWGAGILRSLPIQKIRQIRRHNWRVLCTELADLDQVRILQPEDVLVACPLSCIVLFSSPRLRDFVRARLMDANVYTAILWPLDESVLDDVAEDQRQLSRTMLSIHCDIRYDETDMVRVAALVRRAVRDFPI
ncbi:MAG TPA: hypothetical protein VIM12_20965 [Noviherbaspirillum sp.]|jgi:hypothetical protein|uniref:hypothetical protein n=1 Tax=Noviherbaspirillum sp. TaxID=1926288 RepID=UPI002F92CEC2